ncbi:MAG: hypothetical protein KDC23_02420 [Actinobacteria bacterium]|nr:hypothetical protein [Actinomycetota bacterium]
MTEHPEHLRRRSLAAAPGSPWVTYYDAGSGARVELSAATLDNWIAKASGLLADEYDIDSDSIVTVDVGHHWLLHVWAWSVWALGAAVALPDANDQSDLAVAAVGAGQLPVPPGSIPTLVCASDPFARPLGPRTPPGCIDVMAEIAAFPDVNPTPAPSASARTVVAATRTLDGAAAVRAARDLNAVSGERLLVTVEPSTIEGLLAATLSAATTGGSTVLVDGTPDEGTLRDIVRQERVDHQIRNL